MCSGEEEELSAFDEKLCAVSDWEPWSDCTATCGEGLKMRTRHFLDRAGTKKCPHVSLIEKEKCMEPPCTYNELVSILSGFYFFICIHFDSLPHTNNRHVKKLLLSKYVFPVDIKYFI